MLAALPDCSAPPLWAAPYRTLTAGLLPLCAIAPWRTYHHCADRASPVPHHLPCMYVCHSDERNAPRSIHWMVMHTPVCVCPLGWAQFTSNVPLQVGAQTTTCRRELALCVCATAPSFALGRPPGPSPWSLGISGLLAADAPQHLPLLCFAHALTHALVHVGVFMPAISGSLYVGHAGWRSTRQRRSSRSMGTAAALVCS